jgi:hypothetical protein
MTLQIPRRTLLLFAGVSFGLVVFGIAVLVGIRLDPEQAPMAVYYLSMTCRCPWHDMGKALMFMRPGEPWSIHTVPGPFRYRVLVPWLAGRLPFAAETSLSVVTYASLAISYFIVLLASRRVGLGAGASVCGLALAYVFEPNLFNYYHPFLVDGFALMAIAAMLYALAIDSFWMFAVMGVCGVFARETTLLLLLIWCARDVKRGLALTAAASIAWLVERGLLYGPPDTDDPIRILAARLHSPGSISTDLMATWGWAFAVLVLGIALLRRPSFRTVGPMSAGLLAAALGSYFIAKDTTRLVGVLIPIVSIAAARLVEVLSERRQRILLTALFGLVVLQFCVSGGTRLSRNPAALAAAVRPIRLGAIWVIVAAYAVRRELADGLREKLPGTWGAARAGGGAA